MTDEKLKPSKKKIWRYLLIFSLGAIIFAFTIGFAFASEEISEVETNIDFSLFLIICLISLIGYTLINFGINYGIYKNEFYYIMDNKLNYEFTFIVKKRIALPLEKINVVKIKRNIADLIMGTAVVEIGSGSMSTSLKAEIRLCLDKDFAYKFADYLQKYSKAVKENKEFKQDISTINEQVDIVENTVSMTMSVSDKFKYIISNLAILGVLIGFIFLTLFVCSIYWIFPDAFTDELTFNEALIGTIAIGAFGVILSIIFSIVRAFITFYDYRIEKTEEGIKISYGLISKKSVSATFDKIHGYSITRNIIGQIFNIGSLKLSVIGIDDANNQNNNNNYSITYLYPCASINKLNEITNMFLPTYNFSGVINKSVKKSILHTIFIPTLVIILIMLPLLIYLAIELTVLALIIPCGLIIFLKGFNGFLIYKFAGFGINNDFICTQSGGFVKNFSVIKTNSVQEISTYAGFIRRKQKLCTYYIFYRGSNPLLSRIFIRNVPLINLDDLN